MPMLLIGDNGKEFELALIRERLAEVQDGSGDAEGATISFHVSTGEAEWEETAPCINIFELVSLAEWLEALAAGGAAGDDASKGGDQSGSAAGHEGPEIDLLEPELNFQVVKDFGAEVVIRVRFRLEGRPDELVLDTPTDEARHVDLRISRGAVGVAAAQLRDDLVDFDVSPKDDTLGEEDQPMVRHRGEEVGVDLDRLDEGEIVRKM